MNANAIPVGFGFVGTVDGADYSFKDWRKFDGSKIHVVCLLPGPTGETEEKLILDLFAALRWESGFQLGNDDSRWVAGVRGKRSKFVRIFQSDKRCSQTARRHLIEELTPNEGDC